MDLLKEHKDDWRATVIGQCKSWIDGGLQPRAVTRDLDWGIKVPLPEAEGKVLYVWFRRADRVYQRHPPMGDRYRQGLATLLV